MGLALLYAYRSQTQAVPEVSITAAIQDIQAGKIKSVTVAANKATLDYRKGSQKEQAQLQEQDQLLSKAITDYNTANPSQAVELKYQPDNNSLSIVGSIVLSLLPVLLIGGFFFYMMRQAQGTNNHQLTFGMSRGGTFDRYKPPLPFVSVTR